MWQGTARRQLTKEENVDSQRPKAVFNVRLRDGSEIRHMYDIPKNVGEAWEFLDQMIDMIGRGLSRQSPTHLVFENPSFWYNPENVLGISIEAPRGSEFESFVREAHRTLRVKQATTKTAKA